jgi:hypothetical protein
MAHGMGRSGEIAAEQPKAAGLSLLVKLLNYLAADAMRLVEVGQLCKKYNVCHVVNNAYGVQSSKCAHLISEACKERVDAWIQSTDKNFMVPVGGSIIASTDPKILEDVNKLYPGENPIHSHSVLDEQLAEANWQDVHR